MFFVAMVSRPPWGIASRLLIARFRRTSSNWVASINTAQRLLSSTVSTRTAAPIVWSSRSPMLETSSFRTTTLGARCCRRAHAGPRELAQLPRFDGPQRRWPRSNEDRRSAAVRRRRRGRSDRRRSYSGQNRRPDCRMLSSALVWGTDQARLLDRPPRRQSRWERRASRTFSEPALTRQGNRPLSPPRVYQLIASRRKLRLPVAVVFRTRLVALVGPQLRSIK